MAIKYRVWLVTFRLVVDDGPLLGEEVQIFAQEQAKFLSTQDTGLGAAGQVRFEVAKIEARLS